jgi:cytochrome c2
MKIAIFGSAHILSLALLASAGAVRADGDAARGEKHFVDCAACHAIESGKNGVGPSLAGIFGRKAADNPEFRYSPAMKKSGIVWSAQTLDRYIADPQKAVPANRMPYAGMPDTAARADLIAYLQKVLQ